MGLVPIGFVSVGNFTPFSIITTLIFIASLPFAFKYVFSKDKIYSPPTKIMFMILLTVVISYIHMVLSIDKYSSWNIFRSLNYLLFFVMLAEIKNVDDINILFKRIGGFVVLMIATTIFFFYRPEILDGPLVSAGMGSFRGFEDGMVRIFTPGMMYTPLFFIFIVCALIFGKIKSRLKPFFYILAFFALFTTAIVNSVRTFAFGIIISLIILAFYKLSLKRSIILFTVLSAIVLFSTTLLPAKYTEYVTKRVLPVASNLRNFDLNAGLNRTYAGDDELGTFYWRLAEVPIVMEQMNTPYRILFGATGDLYNFDITDKVYAPHLAYLGIFFCFGLTGVVVFGIFIVYFSRKLVLLLKMLKGNQYEYLALFLLLAWINMLIYGFFGGVFYDWSNEIFAIICALAVILEKLYSTKKLTY